MKLKGLASLLFFWTIAAHAAALSPLGEWKTIDDATHQPKSILRISLAPDQTLTGQVIKLFPRPGLDEHAVCNACTGARQNQPIVGMVVLEHLKPSTDTPNTWTGGEITDPKNGKTYHCVITLSDNGKQLNVRGYIGLPLFGRTQTWERVEQNLDARI